MEKMVDHTFLNLKQLNTVQLDQYRKAVSKAFPRVINESPVIKKYWERLEAYFPEFQLFLIAPDGDLIGFMNTIPFQFEHPLDELPEDGWDWMFAKGIADFENKRTPNFLGGLQVIITAKYQKLGYSKRILSYAKTVVQSKQLQKIIIPIRPTKKHLFPTMPMNTYLKLKEQNETYDPWVRTHLKGGAEIIKVCEHSMSIRGNVSFWESMLGEKVAKSGAYFLKGALKPIDIDLQKDLGEYKEPNIWIKYDIAVV